MMLPQQSPRGVARSLIEKRFFTDLEGMIVQRLHSEAESPHGHAELIRSTGIKDGQLIAELVNLGITAEGLMALRLLPLVLVAWAEDGVDDLERESVMAEAAKLGIRDDSVAAILLHEWLRKLPHGESVDAWKRYMHCIAEEMSDAAKTKLIDTTIEQMKAVAEASGGHLGIGKTSVKEQQMIDGLTHSLRKQM